MRMKVRIIFNDTEREQVDSFARQVGMDVDTFCKRAVFYAINDAYRRAEEAQQNVPHNSVSADSQGNIGEELGRGSVDSSALSNETNETAAP